LLYYITSIRNFPDKPGQQETLPLTHHTNTRRVARERKDDHHRDSQENRHHAKNTHAMGKIWEDQEVQAGLAWLAIL